MATSGFGFHSHPHFSLTHLSDSAHLNLHQAGASCFPALVAFRKRSGYQQTSVQAMHLNFHDFAAFHDCYAQVMAFVS